MIKTIGKKEPDKYELTMGIGMRAWTAKGLICHFKEMPKDAVLVNIFQTPGDKCWHLCFEEVVK